MQRFVIQQIGRRYFQIELFSCLELHQKLASLPLGQSGQRQHVSPPVTELRKKARDRFSGMIRTYNQAAGLSTDRILDDHAHACFGVAFIEIG
ncbi:hypothetical protein D3C78_1762030 [compost metagenome]